MRWVALTFLLVLLIAELVARIRVGASVGVWAVFILPPRLVLMDRLRKWFALIMAHGEHWNEIRR